MRTVLEISYQLKLTPITFCCYKLEISNKIIRLTFPQLLHLRQKTKELTSPLRLTEIIDNENFVLLFIADRKHLVYLDIPQLLDLKNEIDFFFSQL